MGPQSDAALRRAWGAPMNIEDRLFKVLSARPFGIEISQTWIQIGLLFQLIEDFGIGTVVELGLFQGGLADLLIRRAELVGDITYYGFERDAAPLSPRIRTHPSISIMDVFLPSTCAHIGGIIRRPPERPALIYCDDGDKPREMLAYAPTLKTGDYLIAHDFPGEITPASLADFRAQRPFMVELEPDVYRNLGVSLWRKLA